MKQTNLSRPKIIFLLKFGRKLGSPEGVCVYIYIYIYILSSSHLGFLALQQLWLTIGYQWILVYSRMLERHQRAANLGIACKSDYWGTRVADAFAPRSIGISFDAMIRLPVRGLLTS